MNAPRQIARAVALLERLDPQRDALYGDLLEESHRRPAWWTARQILSAATRVVLEVLWQRRRAAAESSAMIAAVVVLVAFESVTAATLARPVVALIPAGWPSSSSISMPLPLAVMIGMPSALIFGFALARLHLRHRLISRCAFGACAVSAAACVLALVSGSATEPVVMPHLGMQVAAAIVIVAALLLGAHAFQPEER